MAKYIVRGIWVLNVYKENSTLFWNLRLSSQINKESGFVQYSDHRSSDIKVKN